MANLNLGQDVANNRKRIGSYSFSSQILLPMRRYGSLININPSEQK